MRPLLTTAVVLVLTVAVMACPGTSEEGEGGRLVLIALPQTIDVDEQGGTTVYVEAEDARGAPGSGYVWLGAPAGQFGNDQRQITLRLEDGKANTPYRCVQALDENCRGILTLQGGWNGVPGMTTVLVRGAPSSDGGTGADAGTSGQLLTHVATRCNGVDCTVLGPQGSGFNEQAQVIFQLVDAQGQPVSGVPVGFSLLDAPPGASVTLSGVTNAGRVTATVTTGPNAGSFRVRAVAVPGEVEAISPLLTISSTQPANDGFSLQCGLLNIPAYVSPNPPADISVPCTVRVMDRNNRPVPTPTPVHFLVEAGSLPSSVHTTASTGTGTVTFRTLGGTSLLPVDVAPLEKDDAQLPSPRSAEPRWTGGSRVHNPRDSLVTLLAYTRGEESYTDLNGNDRWDPGEPFIDQGEPFVDSNDNGVWDPGEPFVDTAGANGSNGRWDGPNGTWDGDTLIWTEARILYTGQPRPEHSFLMGYRFHTYPPTSQPFSGGCGSGVQKGKLEFAWAYCADEYLNRPSAQDTTLSVSHTATKGSLSAPAPLRDGYGFGLERRKRNAVDPRWDCAPSASVCLWKMLFFDWGYGYVGQVGIQGAPSTDATPCQPDELRVTCNVRGVGLTVSTPGAIE